MFDHNHYLCILNGKEGEFKSLEDLPNDVKENFTPLIEIPPITWDFERDELSRSLDNHLSGLPERINSAWGEDHFYIDLNQLEFGYDLNNGDHALVWLFNEFRNIGLNAIPVTHLDYDQAYQNEVREIYNTDGRGFLIRVNTNQLSDRQFTANLSTLLNNFEISYDEIDLLIDLGDVLNDNVLEKVFLIENYMTSVIPSVSDWRSISIAGSSFPRSMSEIQSRSTEYIERNEWTIYTHLISNGNIDRIPTYSDYSIAHPEIEQVDPRIMNMSASIRYTTENEFLILKGRGVRSPGSGGFSQFHALSERLIQMPEYSGPAFSWGDNYINECANRREGPGNATTWRRVGNTHHISIIVNQIASFPFP